MLRIGLTGGIASGKSTVAEMFAELGVAIVDTDVIARQLVQPGQPALGEIESAFGAAVISPEGYLDRKALRAIVFADDRKRQQLERILHPRIRNESLRQAAVADGPYLIIVVPLLVGSPMQELMDRILVVDCDEQIQLERLMARDRDNESQARNIMASQASRNDRLHIADDIIVNDRDLRHTKQQVDRLHAKYLSL